MELIHIGKKGIVYLKNLEETLKSDCNFRAQKNLNPQKTFMESRLL